MEKKLKRRLSLLDDAIETLLRTPCMFNFCPGPVAPIREMYTCIRCRILHRAIQMGLLDYGTMTVKQFSAIDGKLL